MAMECAHSRLDLEVITILAEVMGSRNSRNCDGPAQVADWDDDDGEYNTCAIFNQSRLKK